MASSSTPSTSTPSTLSTIQPWFTLEAYNKKRAESVATVNWLELGARLCYNQDKNFPVLPVELLNVVLENIDEGKVSPQEMEKVVQAFYREHVYKQGRDEEICKSLTLEDLYTLYHLILAYNEQSGSLSEAMNWMKYRELKSTMKFIIDDKPLTTSCSYGYRWASFRLVADCIQRLETYTIFSRDDEDLALAQRKDKALFHYALNSSRYHFSDGCSCFSVYKALIDDDHRELALRYLKKRFGGMKPDSYEKNRICDRYFRHIFTDLPDEIKSEEYLAYLADLSQVSGLPIDTVYFWAIRACIDNVSVDCGVIFNSIASTAFSLNEYRARHYTSEFVGTRGWHDAHLDYELDFSHMFRELRRSRSNLILQFAKAFPGHIIYLNINQAVCDGMSLYKMKEWKALGCKIVFQGHVGLEPNAEEIADILELEEQINKV